MTCKILQGDAFEVLKKLPDCTVDCCVTSPPYYGLRDYGTAVWQGGNPACDHIANPKATKKFGNAEFNKSRPSREQTITAGYYKQICPKCGAVRVDKQIGLEETPEQYIERLVAVFHEVKRVLKNEGTLWVNIGDTYNGNKKGNTETVKHSAIAGKQDFEKKLWTGAKNKDLIGIPWMLAFALRADGWYLRQDIIWHKPNPMPESVQDRCTKSHEYIFMLSKSDKYYYDNDAIVEQAKFDGRHDTTNKGSLKYAEEMAPKYNPQSLAVKGVPHQRWRFKDGVAIRNKHDVWTVPTYSYKGAHFATFPPKLIEPCVLAGCREGGTVLDCFCGSGTTGAVALQNGRNFIGIELNPEYIKLSEQRIKESLQKEDEHEREVQRL